MGILDGLKEINEESFEKILITLLDKDNITTKTEIQRPLKLAQLSIVSKCLGSEGEKDSEELIDKFITVYLEYMVSNKRQSRKEIIAALTEGLKRERGVGEKLTNPEPQSAK